MTFPAFNRSQWILIWSTFLVISSLWIYMQPIRWDLALRSQSTVMAGLSGPYWATKWREAIANLYALGMDRSKESVHAEQLRLARFDLSNRMSEEREKLAKALIPLAIASGLLGLVSLKTRVHERERSTEHTV